MYDYDKLPAHMRSGMRLWIERSILPGGFLTAVLKNDLRDAAGRADSINAGLLYFYVGWLHNEAPMRCWGSPEAVRAWADSGGLEGQAAQAEREDQPNA